MVASHEDGIGSGTIGSVLSRIYEAVNHSIWLFVALCGVLLILWALLFEILGFITAMSAALAVIYGVGFVLLGAVAYGLVVYFRRRSTIYPD